MHYHFTASIVKESKWFVARAIELGVVSQGRTIAEAQKNLQEAVELYLEDTPLAKRTTKKHQAPPLTVLEAKI